MWKQKEKIINIKLSVLKEKMHKYEMTFTLNNKEKII